MAGKEQKSNQSKKRKQIPDAKKDGAKPSPKKLKSVQSELKTFPKKEIKKPFKPSKPKAPSDKLKTQSDMDPAQKREARLKTKADTEAKKKKRKKHYDLQHELATLWEKMRCRNLAKVERSKLVTEAVHKMKGKMPEIARSHVSSRVLQTCVKHCTQDEKDAIFEELKPHFLALSWNKYSVYLVKKMVDGASKKQLDEFISSLHGHVASLLRHAFGSMVVDQAYELGNASQKQSLLLELYSKEFQLFKDLVSAKERRLIELIPKLSLNRASVARHMASVLQPILEKGIIAHSIIHTALMEYMTIADKSSATDVIEQLSTTPILRMSHTKDGSKLAILTIKHGGAKERKKIIKGMKGHIGDTAKDQYGSMVLVCIFSVVDDTKLVTKIVISELQKILNELVFDKSGRRPLLQLLHPNCQRYFGVDDLASLNRVVPSLCSTDKGSQLNEGSGNEIKSSEVTDDKDEESIADTSMDVPEEKPQSIGKGKKDPSLRRLELLVNSGLAESLIDICIKDAAKLLQSNFGKEIIYEVSRGGEGNVLQQTLSDKLDTLHQAIASVAALPKSDDPKEEHVFLHFHSSRTLRRLVLDSPSFASTLWNTALKGKCEVWAKGHSCKVVSAFLESSDSKVRDMAKGELQPLVDAGVLKVPDSKVIR